MVEILLVGDGHIVCIFGGTASNQSVESVLRYSRERVERGRIRM